VSTSSAIGQLREEIGWVEAPDGQRLALTEVRTSAPPRTRDAPAFLLLHGFAQNRRTFTEGPLPHALLARGAAVYLGELRGHGHSRADPEPPWSLRTHLDLDCPALVRGVRAAAGVDRVHLIGHSMGGLLGCALLTRPTPLASLTAVATPLVLGAGRPLVRLASLLAGPFATMAPRGRRMPMNLFLAALAGPLSTPGARGPLRLLQRTTRLANPDQADPEAIASILAGADPESPAVFEELARNAVLRRPRLASVDLMTAVEGSPLPVAAVVGTRDIFAPKAAVAFLERPGHAGPRRIIEIDGGTHVDAAMGHHVPETVEALWDFLLAGAV
jgi:pimeloyl-ACP methyl ester carboxylesterase